MCCAKAEATRAHYNVVNVLMPVIRAADPGAATENAGLVASDVSACPADILANAAVPGADCIAAAVARKVRRYRGIFDELQRAGIAFPPLAWSAEGRPHPFVMRVMAYACEQFARRRPGAAAADILARWKREVGTAITRRIARMIQACVPAERGRLAMVIGGVGV